jgi:hypothetical protein
MQQHRQLSRSRNDGSLLAVLPSTFGQFQAPAPKITVRTERTHEIGLCLGAAMLHRIQQLRIDPRQPR